MRSVDVGIVRASGEMVSVADVTEFFWRRGRYPSLRVVLPLAGTRSACGFAAVPLLRWGRRRASTYAAYASARLDVHPGRDTLRLRPRGRPAS